MVAGRTTTTGNGPGPSPCGAPVRPRASGAVCGVAVDVMARPRSPARRAGGNEVTLVVGGVVDRQVSERLRVGAAFHQRDEGHPVELAGADRAGEPNFGLAAPRCGDGD